MKCNCELQELQIKVPHAVLLYSVRGCPIMIGGLHILVTIFKCCYTNCNVLMYQG